MALQTDRLASGFYDMGINWLSNHADTIAANGGSVNAAFPVARSPTARQAAPGWARAFGGLPNENLQVFYRDR
jgi:hypothetical protein